MTNTDSTDNTRGPELKPCPFCGNDGSKSRLDVCSSSTRHAGWEFTVECTNCGAEGAYAASGFQAKRKWNARADLTPDPQAALDRMLAEARLEGWRAGRDAAADACDWGDIYGDNAVQAIRALPEPKEIE